MHGVVVIAVALTIVAANDPGVIYVEEQRPSYDAAEVARSFADLQRSIDRFDYTRGAGAPPAIVAFSSDAPRLASCFLVEHRLRWLRGRQTRARARKPRRRRLRVWERE